MVNIDLVIVGVFLIITLAIGFYYGKGITTFQDYAVGNRKMTNLVITISLIATIYGGNMLSSRLNIYYDLGLYELIMDLVHPIAFYLASRFVIIRMKEFVGHLSIAESMGSMYGPTVRMLTGIFGIMMTITLLTCQIKIGLNITAILFPETALFSTPSAIFLATLVVFYATFGGARAVALTDVYQFLLFGLCFPMLSFVLLYYAKDPIAGWQKLMDMPQFNIGKMHIWNNGIISKVLAYFIFSFVFSFNPAPIQRFYMAPSVWKAAKVFSKSAIIRIILPMLFLSVAIALYVGGHVIKPNQSVLHYIIGLPYFPGMRGILVTTIIALLMSTADSNLHAASVLFANDVWPMMGSLTKRVGKPSLQVVRVASVVIGIISLFLVLHTRNNAQLFIKTASIYGPVVSIPFLMACFGFRPRSITVLCSMGINIILAIYRIYYTNQLISSQNIFKPLFFSALILLVIHYILPQCPHTGWVGIKEHSPVDLQNQATKQWWKERLQRLTLPFTKSYRKTLFPKKGSTFILFGIYVIISTIIALCFIQKDYFFPYVYGYMSSMAIGTILVIYPTFHSYKKEGNALLHWLWPGLVGMLLFVANLQFAKLGHFSPMVCALFVSNLTLGIVFLSLEISMAMLGIAIITHLCIPPSVPFWNCFWAGYNEISIELIFAMLLITAAMVGLGTYKHLRDKANAKLKVIELRGNYERRIALEAIYNQANWSRLDMTHGSKLLQEMGAMLQKPCHYLYTHGQEQLGENINLFMHKLQKFSSLLLQRAKEERSLELNQKAVKPIEIEPTILKVYGVIRGLGEPMQLLLRNHTEVTQLLTDPSLFECFLTLNIWEISKCPQAADHMVTLTVSDTTLRYDYAIVTQTGKKMLTLPALAFSISTDDSTQNILPAYDIMDKIPPVCLPKTEQQFYQAESRQIVQAHGGYIEIMESKDALTCLYVLPVSGKNVMHFKNYNPTDLAANKIGETTESLAQERTLVELLTTETNLTKEMVEKTIAFIKNAHGLVIRKSGAPYYTHPMAVSKILLDVTKDPSTILAGLLHDVVEDTPVTLTQIELMYGPEVAYIVDRVTHYNTNGYPWKFSDIENKNMLGQCVNIRVIQVKLADRLHNTQTLYAREWADQQRIAKETLSFYIPWGEKNNIYSKWLTEMQHICEEILNRKE